MEDVQALDDLDLASEEEVLALHDAENRLRRDERQDARHAALAHERQRSEDCWVERVLATQVEKWSSVHRQREDHRVPPQLGAAAASSKAEQRAEQPFTAVARRGDPKEYCKWRPEDDCKWQAACRPLGLTLLHDKHKGRALTTARAFKQGEALLRVSPTVYVLDGHSAALRCHHCLRESERLLRCGACGFARYCSAAHQRAAWAEHRAECSMLKRTKPRVPGQTMRLLARLVAKMGTL
eukprot:CAMPEP_0119387790 /NCGR_PEP_ID=MMETSP1334-20130426/102136_1 /TAXON_ID=127549 /ORGANISM="Calcidiscus leptoporus, Strain RCC1130" /LENGTH=238 /DNA_ID=CAMNT_0007409601 /DNA_START=59 /DNA_END=772 /DNA_ORIENTATION=-